MHKGNNSYIFVLLILLVSCSEPDNILSVKDQQILEAFRLSAETEFQDKNPDSALILASEILKIHNRINNPPILFEALIQKGMAWDNLGNPDSMTHYYKKSYDFALLINNDTLIAKALYLIGDTYLETNKKLARAYYTKALNINRELDRFLSAAHNLAHIGLSYDYEQNYDSAITYYHEAIAAYDSLRDYRRKSVLLLNTGSVYKNLGNYQKAVQSYKAAAALSGSMGFLKNKSSACNSLGTVYMKMDKLDSSLIYLDSALILSDSVNNFFINLMATFNKGECLSKMGKYDLADPLLEKVNRLCIENDIVEGQMYYLYQKGSNHINTGKYSEAGQLLNQGLTMSKDNQNPKMQKEFMEKLLDLELAKLPDSSAGRYFKQIIAYKDSVQKEEMAVKVARIESSYKHRQDQTEIETLKHKNNDFISIIIFIVIVKLLLIGLAIFIYLAFKRRKQLLERKNQELTFLTLNIGRFNEVLMNLKKGLQKTRIDIKTKTDQNRITKHISELDAQLRATPFKEFEQIFNELHPRFFRNLSRAFPSLTPRELQICALIKLNMSSKEIAAITFRSIYTIECMRYSVRKKLSLSPKDNLTQILIKY